MVPLFPSCVFMHMCVCVCTHLWVHLHMHGCTCMCRYRFIWVHISMCIHIYGGQETTLYVIPLILSNLFLFETVSFIGQRLAKQARIDSPMSLSDLPKSHHRKLFLSMGSECLNLVFMLVRQGLELPSQVFISVCVCTLTHAHITLL